MLELRTIDAFNRRRQLVVAAGAVCNDG